MCIMLLRLQKPLNPTHSGKDTFFFTSEWKTSKMQHMLKKSPKTAVKPVAQAVAYRVDVHVAISAPTCCHFSQQ